MLRSAVTNTFIAAMVFVVDLATLMQDTGRQIHWDLITDAYRRGTFTVTADGISAIDATTLTVEPIRYPMKKGDILQFGAKKFAKLTADVEAEETDLPVEALAVATADGDTAIGIADLGLNYRGHGTGYFIPAGTVMVEVDDGDGTMLLVPRAIRPATETAVCVLLTDAKNDSKTDSLTGYGVTYGGVLYQNLMPDFTHADWDDFKTELGSRFVWRTSRDSRGE